MSCRPRAQSKRREPPSPPRLDLVDPFQLLPVAVGALFYALRVRGPAPPRDAAAHLEARRLRPRHPPARRRAHLAARRARRGVLRVPHGPAPRPRRPRGALLVAGLTGPVLRPLLSVERCAACACSPTRSSRCPLWAANLYVWHLPFLYEAALRQDAVHALEHMSFRRRGADVVAGRRGAARAGVVRDGLEDGLHRCRAHARDGARQRARVGRRPFLLRSTRTPTGRLASRPRATRGSPAP